MMKEVKKIVEIDIDKIYYFQFTKDYGYYQKDERISCLGTEYMNFVLNDSAEEISKEEFEKKREAKPLEVEEEVKFLPLKDGDYTEVDEVETEQKSPEEDKKLTDEQVMDKLNKISELKNPLNKSKEIKLLKEKSDYSLQALKEQLKYIESEKEKNKVIAPKIELDDTKAAIAELGKRAEIKLIEDKRSQISLPHEGKLISSFAEDVADVFKDKQDLFYRPNSREIVEVGKVKSDDDKKTFNGFIHLNPKKFITLLEKYAKTGLNRVNEKGFWIFNKKSMNSECSSIVIASDILTDALPQIERIFDVPIPIMYEGKLTFPKIGYDKRFNSWLPHNAPVINPNMAIEEAKKIIEDIFKEFCFKDKQDYINSIAALLTPFIKGLLPKFNTRTPITAYMSNQPRGGKDYNAGIVGITFEGSAIEDSPLSTGKSGGDSNDELRKKITAAFLMGRKKMHFANCKGHLDNATFENVATSAVWTDRLLGLNKTGTFDNELVLSFSGNTDMTLSDDLGKRCIFVNLFYADEDANSRKFNNPNLHEWVSENRSVILSALFSLVKNWIDKGSNPGKVPFTSYPDWSRVVGGIMELNYNENPCKMSSDGYNVGFDRGTENMKQLYELCYNLHPNKALSKKELMKICENNDLFTFFDLAGTRSDQTKFGRLLHRYVDMNFSGVCMTVDDKSNRTTRQNFIFSEIKMEQNDKSDIFDEIGVKVATLDTLDTYPPPSIIYSKKYMTVEKGNQSNQSSQIDCEDWSEDDKKRMELSKKDE